MNFSANKKFAYNEMMIHVPLCSHINPKNILVVGDVDSMFKEEIKKHDVVTKYLKNINTDDIFDIIIYTKKNIDVSIIAQVNRSLNQKDGIFVCLTHNFDENSNGMKKDLKLIGETFWICMPYKFEDENAIFASKKFHPQAELILQVSDLLPNLKYYNTEVHNSSFVYPQYIHKELTTIAKR